MKSSLVRFAAGGNTQTRGTTRGRSFAIMGAIIGTILIGYNLKRWTTAPNQPPAGGPSSAYSSKKPDQH